MSPPTPSNAFQDLDHDGVTDDFLFEGDGRANVVTFNDFGGSIVGVGGADTVNVVLGQSIGSHWHGNFDLGGGNDYFRLRNGSLSNNTPVVVGGAAIDLNVQLGAGNNSFSLETGGIGDVNDWGT